MEYVTSIIIKLPEFYEVESDQSTVKRVTLAVFGWYNCLACPASLYLCEIKGPLGLALLGPPDAWQADRSV